MAQTAPLEQARALLPAMVDAVETLVSVESPTSDLAACEAIVQEAVGAFSAWMGSPARIETHGGRPVWRWGPAHPRVLLLGHLDTVWPIGSLERLPFSNDGVALRGPGVFDMKAGIVQGWAALALAEVTEESGVGMLLTTDEETGSQCSRAVIADAVSEASAVLVLEAAIGPDLKSARKGTSWYRVEVEGRAAHAGLDPERGINALVAAADLVTHAHSLAEPASGTTVTPTTLTAGTTANTVPAHASLMIDVRAWTSVEQQRVDEQIRAWVPPVEGALVHLHGGIDRPAMEATASADLLELAVRAAERIGLGPLAARAVGGASDGNLTAALGVPTLDGLGAVGDGAHADHEWASVTALAERAALLAALLKALLQQPA